MNLVEKFALQVDLRPQAAAIIEPARGRDHTAIGVRPSSGAATSEAGNGSPCRKASEVLEPAAPEDGRSPLKHCHTTSFAALDLSSKKIAALIHNSGIKSGDVVLLFQPMSADLYAVLLALFRLGAVAMFLDPSAGRDHIEHCCEVRRPRALIANPKAHLLRLVSSSLRRIPLKFVFGPRLPCTTPLSEANSLPPMDHLEGCSSETPALLSFTSGSTGAPKAAVRTHQFLCTQHLLLERHLKLSPGEVDLATLPIFLLANLASGVISVIPDADLRAPGRIKGEPVLDQIARHRVTRATASPAFFERLLDASREGQPGLRGITKIYTGGAPVFLRLLDQLCAAAPQAKVEAVYGSTEAEPIAHLAAREIRRDQRAAMRNGNGLLAGKPIPEIQLRIVQDQWGKPLGKLSTKDFAALHCATDEPGEIVVTGDHVLKGYLDGRGDEETKFRVADAAWHRTGDAGKLDSAGCLWLLGRSSAKVQDARGLVYPFAVECVAMENEDIRRAAFLAQHGKRLLAIETSRAFTNEMQDELKGNFKWAAIDEMRAFKQLPVDKRHNAKIDYPALIRLLQRE
jgi:acyl-CoA synthetase (AMP-forming)/AMP-acid ligase II